MKYRLLLFIVVFVTCSSSVYSQNKEPIHRQNTVCLELGGTAFLYSVNLQHGFILKSKKENAYDKRLNLRFGVSSFPIFNTRRGYSSRSNIDDPTPILKLLIPVGLNFEVGENGKFFAAGVGRTFDLTYDSRYSNTNLSMGFVKRSPKGFYMHILLHDMFFDYPDFVNLSGNHTQNLFWASMGIGVSF